MPRPASAPLPLGKRTLFAGLAVVLAFSAMEGALALMGIRPVVATEDPYVGFAGSLPLFADAGPAVGKARIFETASGKRRLFNLQRFESPKPPGTFRIFTLGGSTTYGHPYRDPTSFSGWLRAYLNAAAPTQRWEVINCGGISYASYRVAELVKELARHEPDLFIVYSGHNEFLEERTYTGLRTQSRMRRLLEGAAQRTRVYAAMRRAIPRNAAAGAAAKPATLAAEVSTVLDTSIGPAAYRRDDALRKNVVAHYASNLRLIHTRARAAGAALLVVTPAASLRNCSPFKSAPTDGLAADIRAGAERARATGADALRTGHPADAQPALESAVRADPRHAAGWYLLGECRYALGAYPAAREAYERARDEDIVPVRAIGPLIEAARAFAREEHVPMVDFAADVHALAAAISPAPIPGAELFLDHVHPTIEGNRALARRLSALIAPEHALTPAVEAACSNGVYAAADAREQGFALRNVAKVLSWAGKSADAARLARDASRLLGEDAECHFLEAVAAEEARDDATTELHYRRATELDPTFWKAWNNLGVLYARQKRFDEALPCYERAARGDPGRPNIHFNLGRSYLRADRPAEAETALRKAVSQAPDDADAWFLLGEARDRLGRGSEATEAYRQAARLNPEDLEAAEAARRMERP